LGVELIGANEDAIEKAEDRQKFRDIMDSIGLESPKSEVIKTLSEALRPFPVLAFRLSFALPSPSAERVEALPITATNTSALFAKVLMPHPFTKSWSKNLFWDGKNMKWKWSATERITASSFAQLKTLTRWGSYRGFYHRCASPDPHR
jgi:hypothetical protein